MPGYSAQIEIHAPPEEVFAFISNVKDMPLFLPTVEKASLAGEDHIRIEGAANGHPYAVEGWLHIDEDALEMSWGAIERADYHGELQVFETEGGSELACRIEFQPPLETMERMEGASRPDDNFVKARLDAILLAVKEAVEKRPNPADGKVELEPANKGDYKLVL